MAARRPWGRLYDDDWFERVSMDEIMRGGRLGVLLDFGFMFHCAYKPILSAQKGSRIGSDAAANIRLPG